MTKQIFNEGIEAQNWDMAFQVEVLLEYIENQNSPEAFADFIAEQVALEKALPEG